MLKVHTTTIFLLAFSRQVFSAPLIRGDWNYDEDLDAFNTRVRESFGYSAVQDMIDMIEYRNANRKLTHTIPEIIVPRECQYDYKHGDTELVDEVLCVNLCGSGKSFSLTATTVCTDSSQLDCNSFFDCRVTGCTDTCDDGFGGCPCSAAAAGAITSPSNICPILCPVAQTAPPAKPATPQTQKPTARPAPATTRPPTPAATKAPAAAPKTPAPTRPATPATRPPVVTTKAPAAPAPAAPAPVTTTTAPVAPAPAPSNTSAAEKIYTSTTDLLMAAAAADNSTVNVFTLAANTTFSIGKFITNENGTFLEGGMAPLLVRQNIQYKCDNCALVGGEYQVIGAEPADNVRFEGITFRSATTYAVTMGKQGDIVFKSCVFEVSFCEDGNSYNILFCMAFDT